MDVSTRYTTGRSAAVLVLGLAMMSAHLVEGGWTEWTSYTVCTTSCGAGTKTKTRTCTSSSSYYGGGHCVGAAEHTITCNENIPCQVNGGWGEWTLYDECTATCGGGTKTRTRLCNYPSPAHGGADCVGDASQSTTCNENIPCPVNGGWGEWTLYDECTATCGGGTKMRTRLCNYPSPAHGGVDCVGDASQSTTCNENKNCPVNGGWGEWTLYDECTATCGGGTKMRTRLCNYPSPAYGGVDCAGDASQSTTCNENKHCPVNGGWGEWTHYDECTATCGGGTKMRTRLCNYPSPAYGGVDCAGDASQSTTCNDNKHCPVNGGWTEWTYWTSCSNSCGHGQNSRTRTCSAPSPAYGGAACYGDSTEYRDCKHRNPCPQDGGWSSWSEWTVCAGSCGSGRQTRIRTCINPIPMWGGARCKGQFLSTQPCENTSLAHCTNTGTGSHTGTGTGTGTSYKRGSVYPRY